MGGKILLQVSWIEGKDWDEPLSNGLTEQVLQWVSDLQDISPFKVKRWLGATEGQSYCLHLFTDSSEKAYGCCIYLVPSVGVPCTLIYSKAKVAPVRKIPLARLEMQAAYLGAKSIPFICQQLRICVSEVHAWTDSITVYH